MKLSTQPGNRMLCDSRRETEVFISWISCRGVWTRRTDSSETVCIQSENSVYNIGRRGCCNHGYSFISPVIFILMLALNPFLSGSRYILPGSALSLKTSGTRRPETRDGDLYLTETFTETSTETFTLQRPLLRLKQRPLLNRDLYLTETFT